MYVPAHFAADEADALIARISRRAAAILVTTGADGTPYATHLPVLWDPEAKVVRGHIARANPHWRMDASRALIVLAGSEAYVSPSWYPSKAEDGKAVPTWNYEAVHISGAISWCHEPEWLEDLVRALSNAHEAHRTTPWRLEDAPRAYIDALLRAIVGVEIKADRVEAKRKLSQNKSAADFSGVASGLDRESEAGAAGVAALMRDLPPPR